MIRRMPKPGSKAAATPMRPVRDVVGPVMIVVAALAAACAPKAPPVQAPAPPAAPAETPAPPTSPVDMSRPPELGPPPEVSLPPVTTRTLANGLQLMVVEQHELPLADFLLVVHTGGEADPMARPGTASLTSDMMDEGTASRTSLQIADQEAYLGVRLGTYSSWDQSAVSLHTPTSQLDSALALFADVALHPSFPAKELDRVRQDRLTDLVQLRDRGPAIADRAFASIVYGSSHPYGTPLSGTEQSVMALTRAELQRFWATWYRPSNATLIVVGDITPDEAQRRVEALFGGWKRARLPTVNYPPPPPANATTIYVVDKPGAPQSSFRIGAVGVPRSTDDYFAISVMNTILGGAFTSRLNQNLRETHGYTYGARSGFSMRQSAGPFLASAEIVAAKTDSALIQFMAELRGIRDTVPAVELEKAKRYLQLQLPGHFETTREIAGELVPVALYDLPLDFYDSYVKNIAAVTQADVQRVARQYIHPDSLAIVIVGDTKSITPGLRALNFGSVVERTVEGAKK